MLLHNGEFARCYVALSPFNDRGEAPESGSYVVNLDTNEWIFARSDEIYCSEQILGEEFNKWFDNLDDADSVPTGGEASWQILLDRRGRTLVPFHAFEALAASEDRKTYRVQFAGETYRDSTGFRTKQRYPYHPSYLNCGAIGSGPGNELVHTNNPDGTALRGHGGELWVPSGFKRLSANTDERHVYKDSPSDAPGCCSAYPMGLSKREFYLGDLRTAQFTLMGKTAQLKIAGDTSGAYINGQLYRELDAIAYLVGTEGLTEPTARSILKSAGCSSGKMRRKAKRVYVKRAAPFEGVGNRVEPRIDAANNAAHTTFAGQAAGGMAARAILGALAGAGLTTVAETFRDKDKRDYGSAGLAGAGGGALLGVAVPPLLNKTAAPFQMLDETRAPAFPEPQQSSGGPMGYDGPTENTQITEVPVTDMQAQPQEPMPTDMDEYNPYRNGSQAGAGSAGGSGSTGQNTDVTDNMSLVSSLMREPANDQMADQHLPALVACMDALGQLLFQFYQHGDIFADRYGQRDMPELEDALRSQFEGVGDLVIFLKRKTVQPFGDVEMADVGLQTAAS